MASATLLRSASGITMIGELLPSSIVTFLMPAIRQIRSPTGTLPVNEILRTRLSLHNASPISPPGPVRHEIASGGIPDSSSNSVNFSADNGVFDGGLITTALPAAIKPPSNTPLSALKLTELLLESG